MPRVKDVCHFFPILEVSNSAKEVGKDNNVVKSNSHSACNDSY